MFCIHCGTQLPEEARFCGVCGKPVAAASPARQQPVQQPAQPQATRPAAPAKAGKKGGKGLLWGLVAVLAVCALALGVQFVRGGWPFARGSESPLAGETTLAGEAEKTEPAGRETAGARNPAQPETEETPTASEEEEFDPTTLPGYDYVPEIPTEAPTEPPAPEEVPLGEPRSYGPIALRVPQNYWEEDRDFVPGEYNVYLFLCKDGDDSMMLEYQPYSLRYSLDSIGYLNGLIENGERMEQITVDGMPGLISYSSAGDGMQAMLFFLNGSITLTMNDGSHTQEANFRRILDAITVDQAEVPLSYSFQRTAALTARGLQAEPYVINGICLNLPEGFELSTGTGGMVTATPADKQALIGIQQGTYDTLWLSCEELGQKSVKTLEEAGYQNVSLDSCKTVLLNDSLNAYCCEISSTVNGQPLKLLIYLIFPSQVASALPVMLNVSLFSDAYEDVMVALEDSIRPVAMDLILGQ